MIEMHPGIVAGLAAGLLGSAHCLGMCAGISGLFAVNAQARTLHTRLPLALSYNAGRVLSYTVLGAAVAVFGSAMVDAIPAMAGPVRLLSGLLIVLIGLQIAFNWRFLQPIESMGAVLWQKLSPTAQRLLPVDSIAKALGLGLLWGLLPCGLVYSMLLIAATSADPLSGAATMLAFGLGTTPTMLATGLGTLQLSRILSRRETRLGAGLLVVAIGALTLAMPVSTFFADDPHHHHGQHAAAHTANAR